ncbi:MAG: hypothetical protein RR275_04550 [Lachnospiraceae bacterium]
MKQLKKLLILMLCVGVLTGMTACSTKEKDATNNDAVTNETTNEDGMLEDIGNDMKEETDQGVNDVKKSTQDMKNDANQNGVPDKTTDPNMTNEGQ